MTEGQQRAARELETLHAADPDVFQITTPPNIVNGNVVVVVSLQLGPLSTAEGGLNLRDREEFQLTISPDFPFDYPAIRVSHDRFARFPHVLWSRNLCLFQSKIEWNPSDGLYGFFDRLRLWLGKAAMNDMDPIDGPLEPPHHDTDFSQLPFVIRCNAPVPAGQAWIGLAELEEYKNRVELLYWNDLSGEWPRDRRLALAVILQDPLPMEYPTKGDAFFQELNKQGVDNDRIMKYLAWAALFSPSDKSIHLILGLPMRRAADGSNRIHFAVWTTNQAFSTSLRATLPRDTDDDAVKTLRREVSDALKTILGETPIKWCRVFEDRSEIVVRRDANSTMTWFASKNILVLGCGALGSWAADFIARSNPTHITLVDNSLVKPGLLVRQNYVLDDIAFPKAEALANRVKNIAKRITVEHYVSDAHAFLFKHPDKVSNYDIILDCTANSIFHMKLERDWLKFNHATPRIISLTIDSGAGRLLGVVVSRGSSGGIWDAFVRLKQRLCTQGGYGDFITAFYSDKAYEALFQPEPGCSDPTFMGSICDVTALGSTALNIAVAQEPSAHRPVGMVFSMHGKDGRPGKAKIVTLPGIQDTTVTRYRVSISNAVHTQARSWILHNARIRSRLHETGGLLWGFWDDAANAIWIYEASGPPPDSNHGTGHFVCGAAGTVEDHKKRFRESHGAIGFIGFWHTHPNMSSQQSEIDMSGMATLVSRIGENKKRAVMMIFGSSTDHGTADIYVYETHSVGRSMELISIGNSRILLEQPVV